MNTVPVPAPPPVPRLALRPAVAADMVFLRNLSRAIIAEQMESASQASIDLRARAEELDTDQRWPRGVAEIVELDGQPIGRILIERAASVTNVIDIVIHPQMRGGGLGSSVLQLLVERADIDGVELCLMLDPGNNAAKFYRQWGFDEVRVSSDHKALCRRPHRLPDGA